MLKKGSSTSLLGQVAYQLGISQGRDKTHVPVLRDAALIMVSDCLPCHSLEQALAWLSMPPPRRCSCVPASR